MRSGTAPHDANQPRERRPARRNRCVAWVHRLAPLRPRQGGILVQWLEQGLLTSDNQRRTTTARLRAPVSRHAQDRGLRSAGCCRSSATGCMVTPRLRASAGTVTLYFWEKPKMVTLPPVGPGKSTYVAEQEFSWLSFMVAWLGDLSSLPETVGLLPTG
jgi:hypothetical protein